MNPGIRLNVLTMRAGSLDLRHGAFAAAFKAIALTGAAGWSRSFAQGRGAILTMHHVRPSGGETFAPNRLLEITPEFLDRALALAKAEGYDIVPLEELTARLAEPAGDRFRIALTFDDGYRDNLEHARPVLSRHGAPWTLYVTPGFADAAAPLWWVDLELVIRILPRVEVAVGGASIVADCADADGKTLAFARIYKALRAAPEAELRRAVARLVLQARIDSLAVVRRLCMGWQEIRTLAADPAVTIGAHTMTHPMLARHPFEVAAREMLESKTRIEFELGRKVLHFAYPVGDPGSAGPREFQMARDAGFATAVTTRPGHLFAEHASHLHALPRVSLNGLHQNEDALKAMLSGLPFWALNRGRKLNVE